jgi:glc operon protein GlcG
VSLAGAGAGFSVAAVHALTRDGARLAADAAGAVATARGVAPVVAVVDTAGELVYLGRPDAAQVASVGVATDKARTAAIYRRPSKDFEDQAAGGRPSALHLAGAVPLQGGIPITYAGQVVGAIGVSGASSADEDHELATIGAAAFSAAADGPGGEATFISAADVRARFETGGLLVDTPGWKVDAGRRREPGEVEHHERVTDVMYVVDGEATVVSGGRMLDCREVAAGEGRAPAIEGGTRHRLSAGDVLAIPAGVPHQFIAVTDPFLYYVVKVAS